MSDAAHTYAARVDAVNAQRERFVSDPLQADRWSASAARFRMDPSRPLDPNHAILAEYLQPDDVLLDVGGGAGRLSLPLASRCREVINFDPSPAMETQFLESAREAGIGNARSIQSAWPPADVPTADIALVANVTYFVREIVPFVLALEQAARRRVMITVWSPPPPMMDAIPFQLVHDEAQEHVPGHAQLLPVLWEMGILPDVRVLPAKFGWQDPEPTTAEQAIDAVASRLTVMSIPAARQRIADALDSLYDQVDGRFRPRWRPPMREMLITWEPTAQR